MDISRFCLFQSDLFLNELVKTLPGMCIKYEETSERNCSSLVPQYRVCLAKPIIVSIVRAGGFRVAYYPDAFSGPCKGREASPRRDQPHSAILRTWVCIRAGGIQPHSAILRTWVRRMNYPSTGQLIVSIVWVPEIRCSSLNWSRSNSSLPNPPTSGHL